MRFCSKLGKRENLHEQGNFWFAAIRSVFPKNEKQKVPNSFFLMAWKSISTTLLKLKF